MAESLKNVVALTRERLSVFAGGCLREAACAVCPDEDLPAAAFNEGPG